MSRIRLQERATPPTPPTDNDELFISTAGHLCKIDDTGTVVDYDISAGFTVSDTNSVDLTLSGSDVLSADVRLSGSTLAIDASGVKVATGGITNNEVNASAAIAYSKLNLTNSILNADINSTAAIAYSKLAALTASRVLVSDGAGVVSASSVTSTTLGFLDATSSIQTQLNGKANTALSNLASVAVNTALLPGVTNSIALGSSSKYWSASHVGSDIWYGSTSGTLTHSAAGTTTSYSLIWPAAQAVGSKFLQNDGSGNLAWIASSSSLSGLSDVQITSVADAQLLIYNSTDSKWENVTASGDVTNTNAGVFTISNGAITNAKVNASAAIAYSKLNLSGSIVNADVNASAAIAYSKLNLTGSIVNADVNASAAIVYSKLSLSNSIVNADINASAAIAYSKLNLSASIVNADIASAAAIAVNKLAALTASRAVVTDASGFISAATTTSTEIGYVNGVTSAIQTQLNGKASLALDNLASVAINTSLLPGADNSINLGSATKTWATSHVHTAKWYGSTSGILTHNADPTTTSYSLLWPAAQASGAKFLQNDGSGNLTWVAASSSLATLTDTAISSPADGDLLLYDTADSKWHNKAMSSDATITKAGVLTIANGAITNAKVNASAAIAYSKLNLTGSIVNADVNASAAIVYSKLSLSNSIVNADINASAAIAYSKLTLTGSIVNADINASAAIAYSKLNLSASIVNADIASGAAIAVNKLAALTASRAVVTDGSGFISAATTTSTEIGYVNGVTSAIQTQIDGKASTALSNLASTAVNASIIPASNNAIDLGSSSKAWANAHLLVEKMYGATSGNISQSVPATTTSYSLIWPSAQGAANTLLLNDGSGNLSWSNTSATYTTISSNVTLAANSFNFVDTSGARSLTLPAPTSGLTIRLKDKTGTAGTNNITIVRAASEKIEGIAASKVFQTNWGSWTLISDGTDWFIF